LVEFECPKSKTGVLCCDCHLLPSCPFLHPPKPKLPPKRHSTPYQLFQPVPVQISKWNYRLLLLVGEDFKLSKAEVGDLVYYTNKFNSFARRGGRGKSWRRIYALTCIELLRRDKRPIYTRNKNFYDKRYELTKRDTKELRRFVRKEIKRINKTIPAVQYSK